MIAFGWVRTSFSGDGFLEASAKSRRRSEIDDAGVTRKAEHSRIRGGIEVRDLL
jgi:hypothetical protein